MNRPNSLSRRSVLLAAAAAPALAAPALAQSPEVAVKHYILVNLKPGVDQLVLDRWYMTFHAPQVRRAYKAWQRTYTSFRSYLPPAEASARYPLWYGRMTEIQFDSIEDFRATRPNNVYGELDSFTAPPGGWAANTVFDTQTATIPVNPDVLHVSKPTPPKETPYLRWIVFYRLPKGVDAAAWDAWYAGHAAELSRLPGLKRFGSYRTVAAQPYPRVAEFWFDDYAAWAKAFLGPQSFAKPAWGGSFPFADTISMFIGENPDIDFINDKRAIP